MIVTKTITFDVWGKGMEIAEIMESKAPHNGVLISENTKELLLEEFVISTFGSNFISSQRRFQFEEGQEIIEGHKTFVCRRRGERSTLNIILPGQSQVGVVV